jgi:adenylate cyclase
VTGPGQDDEAGIRRAFDALRARTALRFDRRVAILFLVASLVCGIIVKAGVLGGEVVARGVPEVAFGMAAWYGFVLVAMARRRYRTWMRFMSVAVDVTVATLVFILDHLSIGAGFALSGAGLPLYLTAVAATVLRMSKALCLFAGAVATVQYLLVSYLLIRPAVPAELEAQIAAAHYAFIVRAVFILVVGFIGFMVTQTLQWLILSFSRTVTERERVRGLFGVYVSEAVVDELLAGQVPEGGERRVVTVCFTDIRGFTRFSESRPPEEVVDRLNTYFQRMCAVAARHHGVVNKFMGDGMLIVFGAPRRLEDDARHAVAAAREMVAEARRLSEEGEFPDLAIGVGLHRGEVVVGSIGGDQRQEYTVIGDVVNTASRVQDLTKRLGRAILVTDALREAAGLEDWEDLGEHGVAGREARLRLFSPREAPHVAGQEAVA